MDWESPPKIPCFGKLLNGILSLITDVGIPCLEKIVFIVCTVASADLLVTGRTSGYFEKKSTTSK